MDTICFIGNFGDDKGIVGGEILKCLAWERALKEIGFQVIKINLSGWKRRPWKKTREIRSSFKKSDAILIITGSNGWKLLIPFVNHLNRSKNKTIVFATVGLGILNNDKIGQIDKMRMLNGGTPTNVLSSRQLSNLNKLHYIVVENEKLKNDYECFYHLTNVIKITNFRFDIPVDSLEYSPKQPNILSLCYFSRIDSQKGIFDLISACQELHIPNNIITLDIYGGGCQVEVSRLKNQIYNSPNIHYLGDTSFSKIAPALAQYDFLVFPTKYLEGVPGAVIEALQVGLPVIASEFLCSHELIIDGENGLLYPWNEQSKIKDLIKKALEIKQKGQLVSMHTKAKQFSALFNFSEQKSTIKSLFK
jgi:glycosyltransferase involved in cell wall biosynthesis